MGVLSVGVALALVAFVFVSVRRDATPRAAMFTYLALLVFGTPAYFIASFGAGMGLADTYAIGGADSSPWAQPLYLVSAMSLLAAVTIGAIDLTRRSRKSTPPVAA